MDWLEPMNAAIDYIESHLTDEISYDRAAQIACCSTYHFQRMFSYITKIPLSEYIRRRRLTLAAMELQNGDCKVIDIAIKYGYDSPEAFCRAFKKQHGATPISARDKGVTLKAYQKMTFSIYIKGDVEMNYRIEKCGAFELCGLSAVMKNGLTPPKFITQIHKSGKLTKLYEDLGIDTKSLIFALHDFKDDTFSYMIGHYMPKDGAPEGYDVLSVPASSWVVFTSPEKLGADPAEQCKQAWSQVCGWFSISEYEHAPGPELEKGFDIGDLDNGNCNFIYEVWIPIIKKTQY